MPSSQRLLQISFLLILLVAALSVPANADTITISYNGDQHQTVVVQATTFATAIFTGSITNNSNKPVTFQLSGGPVPFEPFVASFQSGIPFPGITLGPSVSTGIIDLAIVKINPFDPSLTYPGLVNIALPAIDRTGATLSGASGNTATLRVVLATPEPSSIGLLGMALLILGALSRKSRILEPPSPNHMSW